MERGDRFRTSTPATAAPRWPRICRPALAIFADLLRRPHLPADQLEAGRLVVLQELRAVEDEPAQKVMLELRRRHYPDPWGRPSQGEQAALEAHRARATFVPTSRCYRPNGTILGVAGPVRLAAVEGRGSGELFADWKPLADRPRSHETPGAAAIEHMPHESNQTQIGIAYASVAVSRSRLFSGLGSGRRAQRRHELAAVYRSARETRAVLQRLCHATIRSATAAGVFCYAGTSAERARKRSTSRLASWSAWPRGSKPELDRLKARIKSSLDHAAGVELVAQRVAGPRLVLSGPRRGRWTRWAGWSTRCRSESINAYLAEHPPRDFTDRHAGPASRWRCPLEFREHVLPNGLEIVAECNDEAHSTALGFFVKTGARDETDAVAGVSHFLEHMMFKGTARRSADDVNREFDEMGAHYNAFTSEENTVYYAAVLARVSGPGASNCWPTSCGRRCARRISTPRSR